MGLPQVTFAEYGNEIAGSRLRASIPKKELSRIGLEVGRDVLVYGKHFVSIEQTRRFGRVIFDICNDHFNHHELGTYYREHAANAHLITVNSVEMARIVSHETGREAMVIPDPWESDEQEAGIGDYPLWFGHESNLVDLKPWMPIYGLRTLTGEQWSREKQLQMLKECSVVLIPKGKSIAKSANRLIESIRNGRFVIACDIPAHEEFKDYVYIGNNIKDGLEWFQSSNPDEIISKIRDCQAYIRDLYSPGRISRLWLEAINRVWQSIHIQPS